MATQDWLVPLAVFGLSFSALWSVGSVSDGDGPAACPDPFTGITFVFGSAKGILRPSPGPLVVVSDAVRPVGWEHLETHGCAEASGSADVRWLTPHVGLQDGSLAVCDFGSCVFQPHLLAEGFNATRVTVHVFDADGELIASNGDATEQSDLTRTFTPEQLPTGVWYLGANATAPTGTQKPPAMAAAFLAQARPMLQGLQAGDVVTTQTDALAFLYGRLYVTLQVDEVIQAP